MAKVVSEERPLEPRLFGRKTKETSNPDLMFDSNAPPPLRPPDTPWKSLALALFLFAVGSTFLMMGLNVFFKTRVYDSIPFLIIGSIAFIPGAFYTFIFVQIFRGIPGYSYNDIPQYDD
uniref:Transmembrane protein 230 n=1 Tax=Chromera velia CCMP2878 TaxID=1169474 RepID=A0A0G4HKS0_9ALVE|mmetsp:Transcript_11061/g.21350  ORF Transcript_11061/g.21350 Transcript_11061/m.21350 type:complete len:119 (-) Transcript_11061:25-381(-)|eukprot:Cvel_28540.t1-p1 / transcript=Cvel_28540.t1 / gene=Cvel_28540 / organism=Chromera_velia_CCMP2878 / gene_product=Transmembrane protein 230, putative / transcript_product=Transmembrane protein 230, putative / location=Cvel_scaffold3758:5457-7814(-) / protein_length=118 / sequence_SO=supercontig / SO=protein_coding / is_pseudo=false